ncbi:hypothetical protein KY284_011370 [Solanum tuberosum]|nr:hypothetical protein KY284_011370 [Solanum tuberosum]
MHHHVMLVYEYVNNGNLKQWLHGAMRHNEYLTWETTVKVSDIGLAKLLGAARVFFMFWSSELHNLQLLVYVAPEYANTGLLNEKSDIYSFGGRVVRIDHRKRSCGLWPSCPRGSLSFVPYLKIFLAHLM